MASIDVITATGQRLPSGSKAPKGARYRARWRTPTGASRTKTFDRKVDAEQFLRSHDRRRLGGHLRRPGRRQGDLWSVRGVVARAKALDAAADDRGDGSCPLA